jgi:hypothetical protein
LLDAAGHSYALIALGTRVLAFASSPSCTWTSETSPPAALYADMLWRCSLQLPG